MLYVVNSVKTMDFLVSLLLSVDLSIHLMSTVVVEFHLTCIGKEFYYIRHCRLTVYG